MNINDNIEKILITEEALNGRVRNWQKKLAKIMWIKNQ